MFEDFSFDNAARSPSLDSDNSTITRDTSRSVSPCSVASPYPRPEFSVTDLAAQFRQQRLRQDSQICYDSCEAYANLDDDESGWQLDPIDKDPVISLSHTRTLSRAQSPSRRIQRQINTRLLCSGAHQKDLIALVSRMVSDEEQCNIIATSPIQADDDEGYNSGESPMHSRQSSSGAARPRLDYRRASDLKTCRSNGCINKSVRLRKDSRAHSGKRSSDKQ